MSDEQQAFTIDYRPKLNPGTPAPVSGQYAVYLDDGTPLEREINATEGKSLPAILEGPGFYRLRDRTQHKGTWRDDEADAMPESET